MDGEEFVFSCR